MKKENLIEKITAGDSLSHSDELLEWVKESSDNSNEYIRYKNLWALLQHGKEMRSRYVREDFKLVKARINSSAIRLRISNIIKYAAIIIIAITAGYLVSRVTTERDIAMNEISVPHGNRTLIKLPDGSHAWLSNGSKIIYPDRFKGKTRDVKLVGEAFFTIKHDRENPFMVNLGDHRIKVLGTEFSVVSYPDDDIIKVDLVSGKVRMDVSTHDETGKYRSYTLKPMHSIVLDKSSGKVNRSPIPDSFFNYWMNGVYEFKNETFASLAKKIERIYDVDIFFEDDELKDRMFTGKFSVDDNIYTMMEVFKRASGKPFEYTIDHNRIYIKSLN